MDTSNLNKDYELASEPSGKDKFEIVENKGGIDESEKMILENLKTNGTQVKSVKKQPGTVWDRIKTGDNNKPVGYFHSSIDFTCSNHYDNQCQISAQEIIHFYEN